MNAQPWPADRVERRPIESLIPYARNPRTHSDEQVSQLAASMREWGWTNPVLVDEEGTVIAGHGRILAARQLGWVEVPVMVAAGWSESKKRAYVIADNKLALNADWDELTLAQELRELTAEDYDVGLLGFSDDEMKQLVLIDEPVNPDPLTEEIPEPEARTISIAGDIWQLGEHKIMCGDSTSADTVARLLDGQTAQLLHADPPYGMGKEADGIANDNLYGQKLDRFQMEWWRAWRPHLQSNGSAYIWGNAPDLWRLWYAGGLGDSEPLTLRNEIVWDKQSIAGMKSGDLTQFPEATERCLFFQLGRYVFLVNQTKDDYWPGWEPIRTWLCEERDRAGFTPGDVKRICENHMYGHWFGTSQWAFISRENYERLQRAAAGKAFCQDYEDLLAQYRDLAAIYRGEIRDPRAEEFRAGRPFFDNTHDIMRDVWPFPRVTGEERFEHATPKPVAMMERIFKSSARERELILAPFAGTGSDLIAAERARRVCFAMELIPAYVDVTVRRWQSLTGKAATLAADGRTFEQHEHGRTQAQA